MWTSKPINQSSGSSSQGGKGGKSKGGYLAYFEKHLANPEYYTKNGKAMGTWVGGLAKEWGVEGDEIQSKDPLMYALAQGMDIDGNKTTERETEFAFFDYQCSAQKSVSILAGSFGDERLIEAHEAMTLEAFQKGIEQFAGWKDQKGENAKAPVFHYAPKVIAARFTHGVGRELDPQLHSHYVVANVVYDENGVGHAIERTKMYDAIRFAGKYYQSRMAQKCIELGYDVRAVREKGAVTGFEIVGVTDKVMDLFSKRRKAIEAGERAFFEKEGRLPSPAERSIIAAETRKDIVIPGFSKKDIKFETANEKVTAYQRGQLSARQIADLESLKAAAVARSVSRKKPTIDRELAPLASQKAVAFAVEHITARRTVKQKHEFMAEAFNQSLGSATVEDIDAAFGKCQADGGVIHITGDEANGLAGKMVTPEALRQEIFSIETINTHMDACQTLIDGFWPLTQETCGTDMRPLSVEQNSVVKGLCENRDRFMCVRGIAGAGKTTTLKHFDRLARQSGQSPIYLAPTTSATAKIAAEITSAETMNTMQFIMRARNPKNAAKFRDRIVVIDESGLKSNKQGTQIIKLATKLNLRCVFVGDALQHKSVESGDHFRVIQRHSKIQTFELTEIFRQTNPAYKAAVEQLAEGKYAAGVEMINKLGWVYEAEDYMKNAGEDWLRRNAAGEVAVVSCPTWAEIGGVTLAIRQGLKKAALIGKDDTTHEVTAWFDWTNPQKMDVKNYEKGMLVTAMQTTGTFKEGRTAAILKIEGNVLSLDNGSTVNIAKSGMKLDVAMPRDISVADGEKLLVHQNLSLGKAKDPAKDLINGEFLTVSHHDKEGNIVTKEGKTIPHWFKRWGHGYAATTHKVQGLSVTSTVVAAARLAGDAAYVGCSRGQESMSLHTLDFGKLKGSLRNDGSREAALDLMHLERAKLESREAAAKAERTKPHAVAAKQWNESGGRAKGFLAAAGDIFKDLVLGRYQKDLAFSRIKNLGREAGVGKSNGRPFAPGVSPTVLVPPATDGREPARESGISR